MKNIKNLRQVGYGLAGVAIGAIVYLTLSSGTPNVIDAKSSVEEFSTNQIEESYVTDENYNGDVVPLLTYGSYRLAEADFESYRNNKFVRYGKTNPTFFYKKTPDPEVTEGESGEDSIKVKSEKNEENLSKVDTNGDDKVTIEEAEAAGYSMPITKNHWLYKYMDDNDRDGQVGDSSSDNSGGQEIKMLEGFNIETLETSKINVGEIAEEFSKSAVLPLDNDMFNVASNYGKRLDPFSKQAAFHAGVDFSHKDINGKNIYSVLSGEVVKVVANDGEDGLGNYVVIDHGKFETIYGHMLEESNLKVGDIVEAGDTVGQVGSTGRSTGPHLHFEVGVGLVKFDGLEFLELI